MTALLRAAIVGLGISACSCAHAAGYPDRPIRMLIGFSPGGGGDILGRVIAQKLSERWGISVLAESFVVTVVGGMGSLSGAVVAGLLVGVVFALTSLITPDLAELSIFVLMALVLLVRPQGLFGKKGLMA